MYLFVTLDLGNNVVSTHLSTLPPVSPYLPASPVCTYLHVYVCTYIMCGCCHISFCQYGGVLLLVPHEMYISCVWTPNILHVCIPLACSNFSTTCWYTTLWHTQHALWCVCYCTDTSSTSQLYIGPSCSQCVCVCTYDSLVLHGTLYAVRTYSIQCTLYVFMKC